MIPFAFGAVLGWLFARQQPAQAAPPPRGQLFGPFDVDGRQVIVEVAQPLRRVGSLRRS